MKRKGEELSDLKNGYYNQTIHTCVLKLHLPLPIINGIYKNLHDKNEVSGIFYVDNNDNVIDVDRNEGDSGSVYTPNNIINYHTHPINAYRNGKTSYGSPSGEDFRETIKFALAGNKAHLVFTVEGLYTIQVSPCKIKKMKELLNDTERGILIFLIESYFKTTHDFRCCEELNELSSKNIIINPYSFVDFANTFDISNLLTKNKAVFKTTKTLQVSKTGHSSIHSPKNIKLYAGGKDSTFSKIPNMGFPTVSGDYITTEPADKFLSSDDIENLRCISKNGEESECNMSIKKILENVKSFLISFNTVPCNIEWNSNPNAWFFVNFFPTQHYLNGSHLKGEEHIMPKNDNNELFISHEPFIRIFSNNKDGCKIKDLAKTYKFKASLPGGAYNMGKRFNAYASIKRKSTFGKINLNLNLNSIYKDIKYLKI